MATTTRAILRQRLSEEMGDYQSLTTTSAGNSAGTSVVDTGLRNLSGGADDAAFEGWYILVTSGANTGESRRIENYISNTTTLVVQEAFSGGAVDTTVTYELHRYDPAQKHQAISRAIEERTVSKLYRAGADLVMSATAAMWDPYLAQKFHEYKNVNSL